MNDVIDLGRLFTNLDSLRTHERVAAVNRAAELAGVLVRKAVDSMADAPVRGLVAQELPRFGSLAIPALREALRSSELEVRILAALVLLQLGSREGILVLLDAIRTNPEYSCLAASRLAEAGIDEAGDVVIARLQECSVEDIDIVVCMLCALEKLDVALPQDLAERFGDPRAPFQIQAVMRGRKGRSTREGFGP